jgi:hypothetical protein
MNAARRELVGHESQFEGFSIALRRLGNITFKSVSYWSSVAISKYGRSSPMQSSF